MSALETRRRIALARELTAAAGFPLRDRYGYAADDYHVEFILGVLARIPDDARAVEVIGVANFDGAIEIADGYDTPTGEDYELGIVRALRPLLNDRRDAAARRLP